MGCSNFFQFQCQCVDRCFRKSSNQNLDVLLPCQFSRLDKVEGHLEQNFALSAAPESIDDSYKSPPIHQRFEGVVIDGFQHLVLPAIQLEILQYKRGELLLYVHEPN